MQPQTQSTDSQPDEVQQSALARALLCRLVPIIEDARPQITSPGAHPIGNCLFQYCCFAKERFSRFRAPKPLIGIVLKGRKELWLGDRSQHFRAGSVFVLPSGPELDVVNVPDRRSGKYESLLVELTRLPELIRRGSLVDALPAEAHSYRVRLTPMLVEAIAHAATELSTSVEGNTLAEFRLAEILTLLRSQPAGLALFGLSLHDRIERMIAANPARPWTTSIVAKELALGKSTLRRKLAEQNTSLRQIILSVRMDAAHQILANGEGNVLQASLAAGYISRSHFARRFRGAFQDSPKQVRQSLKHTK